jgi:tetratricopeptide (TPR) repeat protein
MKPDKKKQADKIKAALPGPSQRILNQKGSVGQDKKNTFVFILILFAVTLALFLPSMNGEFLWDDKYFISENPMILGPQFLQNFLTTPFGGSGGLDEQSLRLGRLLPFYRPLSSLSYWVDYKIWGLNPAGFHLTNIFLHFLNALLLFFILNNNGMKPPLSFLGSLLFAVFPLHFENVSWISGRTDLLSFFFAALSVIFFMKFLKKRRFVFLAFSSFFFLGSLLSKESALFLVIVYFIFLYQTEPKLKKTVVLMLPFGAGLLIWLILRRVALGSLAYEFSGNTLLDFCSTLGFYCFKSFFPFHLSYTIDAQAIFGHPLFIVFGGFLFLAFLGFGIFLLRKRWPQGLPYFLGFSFFLLLLPSLLVIFSSSAVSLLAWRFLYLPSALFLSVLVFWLSKHVKKAAVVYLFLGCLFVAYGLEIYPKNKNFGQTETGFWLGIKDFEREDMLTRVNIGMKYLPLDGKKALEIFKSSLAQQDHPLHGMLEARIYEELASYYTFENEFNKADQYFKILFAQGKSQSQNLHFTYAYYLGLKGEEAEGEKIVVNMLDSFPSNHLVLTHAARFYMIIKNYQRAVELLDKDYRLFSDPQTRELIEQLKKMQ